MDGLSRALFVSPGGGWRCATAAAAALMMASVAVLLLARHRPPPTFAVSTPVTTELFDVQLPPPITPPPPAAAPEPKAPTPRSTHLHTVKMAPAAPAPTRAAAVVVSKAPPEPADLTNTVVMGDAETYAGGSSAANGTSAHASPAVGARADSTKGTVLHAGPSRARRARLAGGVAWSCPFPHEADDAQVDHAVVTLRIAVDASGHPNEAVAIRDASAGFSREATACALAQTYEPALDDSGAPIGGTAILNVRFDR